jgi:hypothetical protein
MKRLFSLLFAFHFLAATSRSVVQAQTSNTPPFVSIVWPSTDCSFNNIFSGGANIKVKAHATDSDGSIAQVHFFADTNLVGVATNAPYSMIWQVLGPVNWRILKAVAIDNLGAITESSPVPVLVEQFPRAPVFAITSPANGNVFSAPASFVISAEVLANAGQNLSSVEFFVGANPVGIVEQSGPFTGTTPPYSLTVSNLPEGDYRLDIRQNGYVSVFAPTLCEGPVIHVTKLGVNSVRLTPNGHFQLDVVTSFPTNQNVIQASSNLLNWTAISTNVPGTNSFTFTEPTPATNSPRFYRAVVPAP